MKTEIIQALLAGKEVQFKRHCQDTYWVNLDKTQSEFYPLNNPRIYADLFLDNSAYNWRIKPESIKLPTKTALMKNNHGYYCFVVNNEQMEKEIEFNSPFFVKWLTDWIDYTIEG